MKTRTINLYRITISAEKGTGSRIVHIAALSTAEALLALPEPPESGEYVSSLHDLGSSTNDNRLFVISDRAKEELQK